MKMKSLTQYIYESAERVVYVLFHHGKNGYNFYNIEDSDAGVATRYSSWEDRYFLYVVKSTNPKQTKDKLEDICRKTEKSWENNYLSDFEQTNDFDGALVKEFGDGMFVKSLIKVSSRDDLQQAACDLSGQLGLKHY